MHVESAIGSCSSSPSAIASGLKSKSKRAAKSEKRGDAFYIAVLGINSVADLGPLQATKKIG